METSLLEGSDGQFNMGIGTAAASRQAVSPIPPPAPALAKVVPKHGTKRSYKASCSMNGSVVRIQPRPLQAVGAVAPVPHCPSPPGASAAYETLSGINPLES